MDDFNLGFLAGATIVGVLSYWHHHWFTVRIRDGFNKMMSNHVLLTHEEYSQIKAGAPLDS